MNNWGIRNQILILAILPSLIVALLLGSYLAYSRLQDLDDYILDRGQASSQQIAILTRHAMQTGNRRLLQTTSNAALEEKGLRAISIFDIRKELLAHAGPRLSNLSLAEHFGREPQVLRLDGELFFIAPISIYNLISDTDPALLEQDSPEQQTQMLGWVALEYSRESLTVERYQTLIITLLILVLATITTVIISLRTGSRFSDSIEQLRQAIMRIRKGESGPPLTVSHDGELKYLADEINAMAEATKSSAEEMRHNIEQTTADLRETLETIEIQNIELDLARKEAVEASRIKSEFLANTSHEIRTPLNGIIGFTNLLLKSQLSAQQKDYMETIQHSSEGLLNIINDILDFSKIEAGKLILDYVPINLQDIIEDTLRMLAPSAHEKELELVSLIYAETPVRLIGDPLRIKQVLTNIISNAIKFTDFGNIIVRVSDEGVKDGYAHLQISISDTGIGLSSSQQRSLFNAFSQADSSISRVFGGTGLGLVISKRLVEQMGGDITLESEEDKGSTFRFTLKSKIVEDGLERLYLDTGKQKHVLLLEFNPIVQLSLQHQLESWGLKVHSIDAGAQLNKQLLNQISEEHPIDVIVLGLSHKQAKDSLDNTAITLENHFDCPLIILSPNPTLLSGLWQTTQRPTFHLSKPLQKNKLFTTLAKLLCPESRKAIPIDILMDSNKRQLPSRAPRILAVDDNPANLKLLTVLLRDMGANVVQASSGLEALAEIEQLDQQKTGQDNGFDLIFMDIQMPELDGVATTQRIRALPGTVRNTPIIALTAHAMSEERERLLKSGFNDHLTKPIGESQLVSCINTWCHDVRLNETGQFPGRNIEPAPTAGSQDSGRMLRLVDLQLCLDLANRKEDLARDMLQMLLDNLAQDKDLINQAYQSDDRDDFLAQVHRLHGATSYTGVPQLKEISRDLETAIKQSDTDSCEEYLAKLNHAIDQLLEWADNIDVDALFGGPDNLVNEVQGGSE